MTAQQASNCVITFSTLGCFWAIRMERTAHHWDAANAPNSSSPPSTSPVNGVAPLKSLEVRIGRLEREVARLMTESDPSDVQCEPDLVSDLGGSHSIGHLLTRVVGQLQRIADHFDPTPSELVGSPYIAERLGCTPYWVTQMVRRGQIPSSHVVPGTGNGKPWKFYRVLVDAWLKRR